MREEIDLRLGRILAGNDNTPPVLVFEQVTVATCECKSLVGYRLDDPDAIAAFSALGRGEGDEAVAAEHAKNALTSVLLPCVDHTTDGSADRLFADLRRGAEERDPKRDERDVGDVIEELMFRHLAPVVH